MPGHPFNAAEIETLTTLQTFITSISFVGSLFIVSSFFVLPGLKNSLSFRMVMYMALCDLIGNGLANFFNDPPDGSANCYFQASIMTIFQVASILWTGVITYCLYVATMQNTTGDELNRKMPKFHMGVWGFSALIFLLPWTTDSYGATVGWCWIKNNTVWDSIWRFLGFYAPLWATMAFNVVALYKVSNYIAAVMKLSSDSGAAPIDSPEFKLIKRLRLYPVVLMVCWGPGSINRVQNLFDPENPVYWLTLAHIIFASFQGFFNALVYGNTPLVRSSVQKYISTHWGGRGAHAELSADGNPEEGLVANDRA